MMNLSYELWSLMPLFIGLAIIVAGGIITGLCLYSEFEARDAAYIAYWENRDRNLTSSETQ